MKGEKAEGWKGGKRREEVTEETEEIEIGGRYVEEEKNQRVKEGRRKVKSGDAQERSDSQHGWREVC